MQTKLTEIKPIKAHELAKKQREISISEFFTKNRHLLGFDNPRKALLTTVKEAVDNSLDACDEARILPDVIVEIKQVSEDRFVVIVEDNGPGIIKQQIPKIFGKLLYGSKFHSMKQTRGQQGIGISASVMYGQLTTGKPAKITSKISKNKPAYHYHLHIDTQKNEPEITREIQIEWDKDQGTKIEIELEAKYQKGKQSVDEYLKQIAIANPYVSITYTSPEKDKIIFPIYDCDRNLESVKMLINQRLAQQKLYILHIPSTEKGSEIMEIIDKKEIYPIPVGSELDIKARVTIPEDAKAGDVYPVTITFTNMPTAGSGAFFGASVSRSFNVVVILSAEEKAKKWTAQGVKCASTIQIGTNGIIRTENVRFEDKGL